ncbi:hypothetical protein PG275_09180 [Riemerella anatipestifer]|nr:hypothetical protein [Riemerella anatipestifer]
MATKLQRYEAVVKLSTGHIVQYHNINTGLYKFHQFLNEKFSSNQKWIFYTVRRKETKEILGTYYNSIEDKYIDAMKVFVPSIESSKGTGIVITLPFSRNNFTINRNLFIANGQVLERNNDFVLISEWLYHKMIKEAKKALYEYYLKAGHQITSNEIELEDESMEIEKTKFLKKGRQGTFPSLNFP